MHVSTTFNLILRESVVVENYMILALARLESYLLAIMALGVFWWIKKPPYLFVGLGVRQPIGSPEWRKYFLKQRCDGFKLAHTGF